MAVKVVSDKPIKSKRTTCPNCAYELEFTGEDVTTVFDFTGDKFQSIVCPRAACRTSHGMHVPIGVKWP